MQANYSLQKNNETSGFLIFENDIYHRPVSLENNRLVINRGELIDTYKK